MVFRCSSEEAFDVANITVVLFLSEIVTPFFSNPDQSVAIEARSSTSKKIMTLLQAQMMFSIF